MITSILCIFAIISTLAITAQASDWTPPIGFGTDGPLAQAVCNADPSISNKAPVACFVAGTQIITSLKITHGFINGYVDNPGNGMALFAPASVTIDGFGIEVSAPQADAGAACALVKIWQLNESADKPLVNQVWCPGKNRAIVLPLL